MKYILAIFKIYIFFNDKNINIFCPPYILFQETLTVLNIYLQYIVARMFYLFYKNIYLWVYKDDKNTEKKK